MKYFFLFLFLFFGNYSVCAQHMISKQLPFFYQLSSNEIFDIYQDREGYLWIGTTNGLARYDGFRLQPFRSDYKNLNLLTKNSISNIVDNSRYVWIGTWKGLNLSLHDALPILEKDIKNLIRRKLIKKRKLFGDHMLCTNRVIKIGRAHV